MRATTDDAMYIRQVVKKLNTFMDRTWEAEAQKGGLTRPQISVLQELYHSPGLSLKELSERMDMAHSTVSGIIDRLERKGLVEKRADPKDKRVSRLYVSSIVDSYVDVDMQIALDAPLIKQLSQMTDGELAQIRGGLAALERAFLMKREDDQPE